MKRGKGGCTVVPCRRKASLCNHHLEEALDDLLIDCMKDESDSLKMSRTPLGVYNTVMGWPPDMQERFQKMWDKRNER